MKRQSHQFLERLSTLVRAVRAIAAQSYASFGVGSTQARFLRHIGENAGISQAELARATDTDPTLTGRVLGPLIARGWVRRKRSERDRRQYVLELAPAGQRIRKRVDAARGELASRLAKALDARDHRDFERIVGKILASLDAGEETTKRATAKRRR